MISNPRHGSPPRLMAHQPTRCSTTQESSIRVHRPDPVSDDAGRPAPTIIWESNPKLRIPQPIQGSLKTQTTPLVSLSRDKGLGYVLGDLAAATVTQLD